MQGRCLLRPVSEGLAFALDFARVCRGKDDRLPGKLLQCPWHVFDNLMSNDGPATHSFPLVVNREFGIEGSDLIVVYMR